MTEIADENEATRKSLFADMMGCVVAEMKPAPVDIPADICKDAQKAFSNAWARYEETGKMDFVACLEAAIFKEREGCIFEHAALAAENDRLRERLEIDPGGGDAIDVLESAADFLRHRIDCLEKAMKLVVGYDDLLRRFEGPAVDTLFAGDVPTIDAAYDEMVCAVRAAMGAPVEV